MTRIRKLLSSHPKTEISWQHSSVELVTHHRSNLPYVRLPSFANLCERIPLDDRLPPQDVLVRTTAYMH